MRLAFYIAKRYLFSKKKNNSINIVSMICAAGVCIGTMALVCILSVYNGFQDIITESYNAFDPDIRITRVGSKTFDRSDEKIRKARTLSFVETSADVLEENGLIKYGEKQTTVTLKGVSENYARMIGGDTLIREGQFVLQRDTSDYMLAGLALSMRLGSSIYAPQKHTIYAPIHNAKISMSNPEGAFNQQDIIMSGIYSVNQEETDAKNVFIPIRLARSLYGYAQNENSSVELKLKSNTDIEYAKKELKKTIGEEYKVEDRKEQHEDFYKMLKIEKWITFLILTFILLIAIFNVIGSLTMLILEKESDISTLSSLGETDSGIKNIFLIEGWMISAVGAIAGTAIGLLLCFVQIKFGIITLGNGEGDFIIDAYPVSVKMTDIVTILSTVLALGLLIAWYPTRHIKTEYRQNTEKN